LIGVPLGAATSPNKILMLDYRDLDDAEDIAGRPPINITYAGRKTAADKNAQVDAVDDCGQRLRARRAQRRHGLRCPRWRTPGVGGGGATGRVYH